jgi:hypothetical protein
MANKGGGEFPWRAAILGPLTVILFALALHFYNNLQQWTGLLLLGVTFAVPMIWAVLAARDAETADSPIRQFVPRMTAMLVLGSAFLGFTMWSVDPRITAMEGGFVVFYIGAAYAAIRILEHKPKRPQLKAVSGGNPAPRQRPRSR